MIGHWQSSHKALRAKQPASSFALRAACIGLAGLALAASTGCVQRRLTLVTNPPGAMAYIGDEEIGTTPVSTDFVYYGNRKIRLEKPGFETLTVDQPIPPPWYQIPPLDFISDNFALREIRDERVFTYDLDPQVVVPRQELLRRADALRAANGGPTPPGRP